MCFFLLPICSGIHVSAAKNIISSDSFKTYPVKFNQKANFNNLASNPLNRTNIISFNIRKDLSDNELKDLLKNVEDNTIKLCYSRRTDKLLDAKGKTYLAFTDKFNSEEKVHKFFKNFYTYEMSTTMMEYLGTTYIDGNYSEICGDWGDSTDWNSITITDKHYSDNNTLEFTCDYFDQNSYSIDHKLSPKHYYSTYKLKYEDGKWLVAYNSNFK